MARTVLLADDSVTAQNMGRRILTDAGYEVITVNNGSAALKKIHESRPDLIVLDVYMPGYGGLEVCQRLKESEATMKIPVLLTVGKMEPFKTDEAKRVRADGHIIKPFDASELLAALAKLEDRIVPQSDNNRGRSGKAETKKPRRWKAADPIAAADDDSNNDRISYLEQVKKRQTVHPNEADERRAGDQASASSAPAQPEEAVDEAVTFASGPIYQPASWASSVPAAPEFPIEAQVETSQGESVSHASVSAQAAPVAAGAPDTKATETPVAEPQVFQPMPSESAAYPVEGQVAEPPRTKSDPHWIAENVAVSADEASRSLDEEMRQAQAIAEPSVSEEQIPRAAVEESQPVVTEEPAIAREESSAEEQPANAGTPDDEVSSGAAFAAAAASGGAASTEAVAANGSEQEPAGGVEAAAAWENWQRIRDSVVNQHLPEALAESVANTEETSAGAHSEAQRSNEPNTPTETSNTNPPSQSGSDALSSIVDSVLAELKPRLLAEIAKQLSTDKK